MEEEYKEAARRANGMLQRVFGGVGLPVSRQVPVRLPASSPEIEMMDGPIYQYISNISVISLFLNSLIKQNVSLLSLHLAQSHQLHAMIRAQQPILLLLDEAYVVPCVHSLSLVDYDPQ